MDNSYEAGKVLVGLNRFIAPPAMTAAEFSAIFKGLAIQRIKPIFHANWIEEDETNADAIYLIELVNKDTAAVIDAVERLSAHPYVDYAEPDYVEDLHGIPNDRLYKQLWGTQRIGAPTAWNYSTGNAEIAVGVIDSGVDYNHPDIRENMWISPDGRLRNGWNFADNTRSPMDVNGHGTHVAGTIGAVGNNCIGITGICWTVGVVALKFGLDNASAIESIDFANRYAIPILNASWGGRFYSRALKYAIDHYTGLFIASAGNDSINIDTDPVYPAAYDSENILAVAATAPNDTLSRFSNYGVRSVDLAAPGTDILSLDLGGRYSPKNGTSMAAPHVAGAAALLKSYRPNLSTMDLKNILLSSADRLPTLTNTVRTGGMLNVNAMFQRMNM